MLTQTMKKQKEELLNNLSKIIIVYEGVISGGDFVHYSKLTHAAIILCELVGKPFNLW